MPLEIPGRSSSRSLQLLSSSCGAFHAVHLSDLFTALLVNVDHVIGDLRHDAVLLHLLDASDIAQQCTTYTAVVLYYM
jgi:hypothetical protein